MQNQSGIVALVGLDIGKNVHEVGSFRSDTLAVLHEPFSLYNNQTAFEQLASHLDSLLRGVMLHARRAFRSGRREQYTKS